jgi:hypothetical protein
MPDFVAFLFRLLASPLRVVPTVRHRILFVITDLAHLRRRVVHFNATEHPTAAWTARQLTEAFPWDTAPRYMIRDRVSIYGDVIRGRVKSMGNPAPCLPSIVLASSVAAWPPPSRSASSSFPTATPAAARWPRRSCA